MNDPHSGSDGPSGLSTPDPALSRLIREHQGLKAEVNGLRQLLETTRSLSSILDPDQLLDAILDSAILLTRADRGLLLSLTGKGLHASHARGNRQEALEAAASRVSETLVQHCLEQNRAIPYDNLSDSEEFREVRSIQALALYSAVCVPLRERGEAKGVLYLDSSSAGLRTSPQELLLLEAFASQASICLLNARLMRQSEESRLLLARENKDLRAEARSGAGFGNLLGQSHAMQELFGRMRLLKDAQIPVLILGESGTGKELVARALHYEGVFRDSPFVPVNCAGLPGDLLDSLMFGHRRGAFTGAVSDMPGFVEQAHGGTLFLDEIGDMPMALQVKLLRFLESGEFRRVGEIDLRRAEVRLLSATNQDLARMVQAKTFREDLYFRLAGVCLEIPPLRERRADIPLLMERFFQQAMEKTPRRIEGMTERTRAFVMNHAWPGNVRQLKQAIEAACSLVPEGRPLDLEQVQMVFPQRNVIEEGIGSSEPVPDTEGLSEAELLESILRRHAWNVTHAAQELGISRQHLYNRIRMFGLKRP